VSLRDGRSLEADLFLVAAGISPNKQLAQDAGLNVNRGVIVDDELRTSAENVWAVGDVAEHRGQILGLWPTAVDQAEVAAENLLGGERTYEGTLPVTMLKVVGVQLTSIGRIEEIAGDELISLEEVEEHKYRKLLIDSEGRIAGAILLGYANEAPLVQAAIKEERDVRQHLDALRAGDWTVLQAEAARL
jgi:NAD(P)H-nitrite reductase large subunit